ncbi:hypothetical protein IQ269_15180 [Tychonema sp. LEGE 07199]|uniref:hypothetical protein n=1 Tax=unclassified Tychonema TaxID=2642144 RepID=UPI00187FD972|nr:MULTISPECIES: hypothetical protein [unclassified Tychonema]MBE9122114.1 hypothetical protein [Tychonema sp. LEGE 07199]MBE9134308.1 hypothetical protein [Tychonema sp. LEGE 07196]
MVRIINGVVFEDGKPGKRVINTNGGNYVEKIEGDFIAGTVINYKPTPTRQDLSKDGDAIDVKSEEV